MKLSDDKSRLMYVDKSDLDNNGAFRVPDGVYTIEAIGLKHDLKAVDLNEAVVIGDNAFQNCKEIEQIIGSPQIIGKHAFNSCSALSSMDLSKVLRMGEFAFYGTGLVQADISGIPLIPASAFECCSHLRTVVGSPRYIGASAFESCVKLRQFDFSNTIKIGVNAFCGSGIVEADISNLSTIEQCTFEFCSRLEKVIGSPQFIESLAFCGCTLLKDIDLTGLEAIGANVFDNTGIIERINEGDKTISIRLDDNNDVVARFARLNRGTTASKVDNVIDEDRNLYTDKSGNPFVFDDKGERIYLAKDRKRFLELCGD